MNTNKTHKGGSLKKDDRFFAAASALLEAARAMARHDLSEGRCALAKLDFVAAIAKYKEAAAHSTDR